MRSGVRTPLSPPNFVSHTSNKLVKLAGLLEVFYYCYTSLLAGSIALMKNLLKPLILLVKALTIQSYSRWEKVG